ncbi:MULTISPECIES: MFS transporter [Prauserella salsuginis group]|uniref:MFS transporter n=1 Tax=Prauserella salsuginis TaxID=387889 RepID=A0ABW6G488_9PSEU|nr:MULTISPECIES: MFS transporter [Prauserella salsuginis group]MCR3718232.1 putative arabinose efflux permease, MFS family [Prauserella flava]MCR3732802.1 putative arabinose efflux permease, MFS family [Prauserella salsuginis]
MTAAAAGDAPAARAGLQLGALLGPFGGGVVAAVLPEIGASFGVSAQAAASSLTVYLLPFAALMLVSGTLGQRWGPARTIRLAYVAYAVFTLAAAVAPWFWLFQVSRGLQGCANAFTTPLLMARLAAMTPPDRLGRALGVFGAMQAVGQTSAPLVGGLAAEASWRWAFAGIALVGAVLATWPLPADDEAGPDTAARLRDPWRASVLLPGLAALAAWGCMAGLSFLFALRMQDAFGFGAGMRGLLLTGFGVAGFLAARFAGAAADRFGGRLTALIGLLTGAALVLVIGATGVAPVAVAAWAAAGVCSQLVLVAVNTTVLSADGPGRSGAISVVQAMRFLGMAAAPAVFTAPYHADPLLGFALPAAVLLAAVPLTATLTRART